MGLTSQAETMREVYFGPPARRDEDVTGGARPAFCTIRQAVFPGRFITFAGGWATYSLAMRAHFTTVQIAMSRTSPATLHLAHQSEGTHFRSIPVAGGSAARRFAVCAGHDRARRAGAHLRRLRARVAARGAMGSGPHRARLCFGSPDARRRRRAAVARHCVMVGARVVPLPDRVDASQGAGARRGARRSKACGWDLANSSCCSPGDGFCLRGWARCGEDSWLAFAAGDRGIRIAKYLFAVWIIPVGLSHFFYTQGDHRPDSGVDAGTDVLGVSHRRGAHRGGIGSAVLRCAAPGRFCRSRHAQRDHAAGVGACRHCAIRRSACPGPRSGFRG